MRDNQVILQCKRHLKKYDKTVWGKYHTFSSQFLLVLPTEVLLKKSMTAGLKHLQKTIKPLPSAGGYVNQTKLNLKEISPTNKMQAPDSM